MENGPKNQHRIRNPNKQRPRNNRSPLFIRSPPRKNRSNNPPRVPNTRVSQILRRPRPPSLPLPSKHETAHRKRPPPHDQQSPNQRNPPIKTKRIQIPKTKPQITPRNRNHPQSFQKKPKPNGKFSKKRRKNNPKISRRKNKVLRDFYTTQKRKIIIPIFPHHHPRYPKTPSPKPLASQKAKTVCAQPLV